MCRTDDLYPMSNSNKVKTFQSQGFLTLPLLSSDTCMDLRAFINADLEETLQQTAIHENMVDNGTTTTTTTYPQCAPPPPTTQQASSRLCNIRSRTNRWDLKLDATTPVVRATMLEILECDHFLTHILAPVCRGEAEDIVLAEFGALISDPGAPAQDWHPDSAYQQENKDHLEVCCFVTLQDTPGSMGPTEVIPYTHTQEFHEDALRSFPPKGIMPTYASPKTMQAGYERAGEACVMDCRLYHRGGANQQLTTVSTTGSKTRTTVTCCLDDNDQEVFSSRSSGSSCQYHYHQRRRRRHVFYFTVRSRTSPRPAGSFYSILKELDGKQLVDFLV